MAEGSGFATDTNTLKLIPRDENKNENFIVIPQNGQAVLWDYENDDVMSPVYSEYIDAINGTGREDTFYGGSGDYSATLESDSELFQSWCDIYKDRGVAVLSIDYCTLSDAETSFNLNDEKGYVSFCALDRNLTEIPSLDVHNENSENCTSLSDCKNFLYILNLSSYSSKEEFIQAVLETNYDAIIMDAYFNDGTLFTASQIENLKTKANGGTRLVISYMSIGEAEDYRWYWDSIKKKSWVLEENADWEGNYKVEYWTSDWQSVIYGSSSSYLAKILSCGFDGVYLDIIDAYEYFEDLVY